MSGADATVKPAGPAPPPGPARPAPRIPHGFQVRPVVRSAFRTPIVAGVISVVLAAFGAQLALTKEAKVALAAFVSVLAGLVVLLEPGIGILAYYNLAFMRPQETLWGLGGTHLTQTVSMFTLAAAALHFVLRPNLHVLKTPQTVFLCILWAFLHLSAYMNVYGTEQARWLSYYDKMFLIYFVAIILMTNERWLFVLAWVIAISIGYLAYWANSMYFVNGWATVHGPGKPGATYYDENGFATILVMVVPFCWYLMGYQRKLWLKAAFLGGAGMAAHAVMLTFSRGGFLGLASVGGLIVVRMRNRGLAVLVAILGITGFISVTGPRYVARIFSIGDYQEDKSATGRLDSWQAGMKMMLANPIFGVGFKRYTDEFHNYSDKFAREAHNSWVQLGAESGMIAVSAHLMLLLLTWRALLRVRRRIPLLPPEQGRLIAALEGMYESALLGYMVCGFFLSMEDFEFYYLLVAMSQILDRVSEHRVLEAAEATPVEAAA